MRPGWTEHRDDRPWRMPSPLLVIDSTVVQLVLSMFDWVLCQMEKGAAKIHLVLEHQGPLPHVAVITEGKGSDLAVDRGL